MTFFVLTIPSNRIVGNDHRSPELCSSALDAGDWKGSVKRAKVVVKL